MYKGVAVRLQSLVIHEAVISVHVCVSFGEEDEDGEEQSHDLRSKAKGLVSWYQADYLGRQDTIIAKVSMDSLSCQCLSISPHVGAPGRSRLPHGAVRRASCRILALRAA